MLSWEVDFKERHDHRKSLFLCGQALSGDSHTFGITGRRPVWVKGCKTHNEYIASELSQIADVPIAAFVPPSDQAYAPARACHLGGCMYRIAGILTLDAGGFDGLCIR